MPIVFNICQNFKIGKLICNCKSNNEHDTINPRDVDFELIKSNQIKFDNLIPSNDDYLFFKINSDETIISVAGNGFEEMPLKNEDILNKKLKHLTIYKIFFQDYIRPLFMDSINKGEAFQFEFLTNITDRKFICSLYPCSMPNVISSCDVVIRHNHGSIGRDDIRDYVLHTEGEKVDILQ